MIEATTLFAAVCLGALLGVLVLLRVGSGREDRWATLRQGPPTRTAAAARRMTGLYVRMPQATADPRARVRR